MYSSDRWDYSHHCGAPAPLPENDPLITEAINAFEAGCLDTAPGFTNAEDASRAQGVTKIEENGTALPFDRFGMTTFKGDCAVGIKGEAGDALEVELIALLKRRNLDPLEEVRDVGSAMYAAKIDHRGQEMGAAISGRSFPSFGYWSLLILVPNIPEDDGVFKE